MTRTRAAQAQRATADRPALAATALTFHYPGAHHPALADVALDVAPAAVLTVAGPNGSGRSTLLAVLAGLAPAATGGRLDGAIARAGPAAMVLADPYLNFSGARDTVRAELAFGLECRGVARRAMVDRVAAALEAFDLAHLAARDPFTLSGGEAARLAVACQAVVAPATLLVDEVDAQLDAAGARAVGRALGGHVARGGAVVRATGRLDDLAVAPPAVRDGAALVLQAGRAVARGRVAAVAAQVAEHGWGIVPAGGPAIARRVAATDDLGVDPNVSPGDGPSDVQGDGRGDARDDLAPPAPADLAVDGLVCRFAGEPAPILDGATLAVAAGTVVALHGPNGAGKTSLARAIAGLQALERGTVRVGGRPAADAHVGPRRGVGLAMQRPERMLFRPTVADEVAIGLRWMGVPRADAAPACAAALAACGLADRAADHPHDLLPSERRWLALAAIVALRTPVVVLDEPTAGFDARDLARFARLLERLAAAGRAVVWITHDGALAERLADRRLRLIDGRVTDLDGAASRADAAGAATAAAGTPAAGVPA